MRIRLVAVILLILLLAGCNRGGQGTKPALVQNPRQEDAQKVIKDLAESLHLATDARHYRDALGLVNTWLTRNPAATLLDAEERTFLQDQAHLTGEELATLEASTCPRSDAHHLASCCLFRDAAAKLELTEATPLDRARAAFAWTMRRVVLHEQGDTDLPPALVLRRGYGNSLDRALVLVELLRALEVPAGIVTDAKESIVLVGVAAKIDKDKQLVLFDPRLGLPVYGAKDQTIATLAQARAQPELLKASGVAADAATKLEVRAAVPLEALSPRLRNLENALAKQTTLRLAVKLPALCRTLEEAAGAPVTVWNLPAGQGLLPNSPLRRARLFFPPDEGGLDTKGRWAQFNRHLVPWTGVLLRFRELNLDRNLLTEARDILMGRVTELFNLFYVQPEEEFLHGQHEAALLRLARLRDEIDHPMPYDDREFARHVAQWREAINEAYLQKKQGEPGAEARIHTLWSEDQFSLALVQLNLDLKPYQKQRKTLTQILFSTSQDLLSRQSATLLADCLHEKAAWLEGIADRQAAAGKNPADLRADAALEWDNARGARVKALERLRRTQVRRTTIQNVWEFKLYESAVGLWEEYHRELHESFRARSLLAQALGHAPRAETRQSREPLLQELRDDVAKQLKQDTVKKSLEAHRDLARTLNRPDLANRLDLLLRDWAPQGHLYWFQQSIMK